MKNHINALKLTLLGGAVAALGLGCASSGYARSDADGSDMSASAGVSAQTEVGMDESRMVTEADRAAASSTLSALGRTVETRADWVNRFQFYDMNLRTIEHYTFAVPESDLGLAWTDWDDRSFNTSLPPGSVFTEAAGGGEESRTGRVIQHSANPSR
jgi:hypothetical protein